MKIQTVTLREKQIIETENGYEEVVVHEQKYPASITNYSLSMGEKLGLIESSQVHDLADLEQVFLTALNPNTELHDVKEMVDNTDRVKFLKVIYLAIIGVNPQLKLTYDEFTQLYHEDFATTVEIYTNLVLGLLTESTNNFAKGWQNSTKKK